MNLRTLFRRKKTTPAPAREIYVPVIDQNEKASLRSERDAERVDALSKVEVNPATGEVTFAQVLAAFDEQVIASVRNTLRYNTEPKPKPGPKPKTPAGTFDRPRPSRSSSYSSPSYDPTPSIIASTSYASSYSSPSYSDSGSCSSSSSSDCGGGGGF